MSGPNADDVERVARALHSDDYPQGEWEHVKHDFRVMWRAMARTVCSVSMWGDYLDAAKRLAQWDDIDKKKALRPFDERDEGDRAMWLRRAEVGFLTLQGKQWSIPPRAKRPPMTFPAFSGDDDGA